MILDLGLFSVQFVKSYDLSPPPEKQHIINQLHQNPSQGRIMTLTHQFKPNDGLTHRFPSVLGYDPLILKRYVYYIQASQNRPFENHVVNLRWVRKPSVKFIQMLHVTQVVKDSRIISCEGSIPYAVFVPRHVIKSSADIISFMKDTSFNPREMVVLETEYPWKGTDGIKERELKAEYSVIEYGNDNIRIKTSSGYPGYLVLSEIYYPGWKAKVDGKEVPVLRGNYLFRVIPLEKGDHEVRLYFVSWPFRIGATISLFTFIFSLFFIWKTFMSPSMMKNS
jgi:hypothetical protein